MSASNSPILAQSERHKVEIRPMRQEDVARVVEVHLAAFPEFFLTFLGARFLRIFYSEALLVGELLFVAIIDQRVVGFVMGSTAPGGFFKKLLLRKALTFAWASLPALVRQPSSALRIARALRKPKDAAKGEGTATLMSLGVDPSAQGCGVGKRLVRAFLKEASQKGSLRVDLTTDKKENASANAFYQSLGFKVVREIVTPENRVLNEYEIDLSCAEAGF
jgi:ribosomal protein S18 acetylase RimI-like enzyme